MTNLELWVALLMFALIWCGITATLSVVSGWHALARDMRAFDAVEGERFRFASGFVGGRLVPVSYGRSLFLTVNMTGLRLSVFPLLRLLAPPLFVRWSQVETIEDMQILLFRSAVIRLRGRSTSIRIRGRAGVRILETYAQVRKIHGP
jgi:hypothetical protein